MTPSLYFSRVRLSRNASVKALAPLLLNGGGREGGRHPGHHLIWSLFADQKDRCRDFLWREMEPGHFLLLSPRQPKANHELFEIDPPKPFAPKLANGDRLCFSLRANPVVRRRSRNRRSAKHDVVMDALRDVPAGQRAEVRFSVVQEQGFSWLERQAAKSGFEVQKKEVGIDGHRQLYIARRGKGKKGMTFTTLDFDGLLRVRDPALFLSSIACGFGAAKAYGCGLMLIRRT